MRFLILLLLFASCSVTGPLREDRPATDFSFPEPLKGWKSLPLSEGAQRLYQHSSTGSVLSMSSLCDRYATAPLNRLLRTPLSSLGAYKELEFKNLRISDRDAEQLHVSGSWHNIITKPSVNARAVVCLPNRFTASVAGNFTTAFCNFPFTFKHTVG